MTVFLGVNVKCWCKGELKRGKAFSTGEWEFKRGEAHLFLIFPFPSGEGDTGDGAPTGK
jgi:hypothetical protein